VLLPDTLAHYISNCGIITNSTTAQHHNDDDSDANDVLPAYINNIPTTFVLHTHLQLDAPSIMGGNNGEGTDDTGDKQQHHHHNTIITTSTQ